MNRLITLTFICLLSLSLGLFADNIALPKEQTLAIIKPNAVSSQHIGDILHFYEQNGLAIIGLKMVQLTRQDAEAFYAAHKDRPFFNDLVKFMSSGPVVALALQGPSAVTKNRDLMGATDPSKASDKTLRKLYGKNITENAVHGSDSIESARQEISFFFSQLDLVNP